MLAARKAELGRRAEEKRSKAAEGQRSCPRCGLKAKWLTEGSTVMCDRCERLQLAAEGRLPPGISIERNSNGKTTVSTDE